MPISILLAEDHQVVRQGLRALLEQRGFVVSGEASDGREAVALASRLHPDVAVFDLEMPVLNGLDAARETRRASPSTKVILLTMHTEDHYVLEALHAGVKAYVVKTRAADDLVQAIHEAQKGSMFLSPSVSRSVVDAFLGKTELAPDPLSARERQVLQLVAEGRTTKQIAALLGVSVRTAESHRHRTMEKLGLHDTAALVRYAIRRGLIQA